MEDTLDFARLHSDKEDMINLDIMNLVSWTASGAMVFGGVVPYIPQYLDIWESRNVDGFSIHVCLALLVANILRIFFWFGRHFELPLLAQSFIMIIAMLAMLQLCTKLKKDTDFGKEDLQAQHFWNWSHFRDYLLFLFIFISSGAFITYLFLSSAIYMETLGFVAVFTEAMLGAPQFYRNHKNKSTVGMSVKMVAMWLSGDTFKTCYFIVKNAPVQFWICGMMQIVIDISILFQVYVYSKHAPIRIREFVD